MKVKLELSEEQKKLLEKLPVLEQLKLKKHFAKLERRKRDNRQFYQPITVEEIDEKIISLENYYVRIIAGIIAEQYMLDNYTSITTRTNLYTTISIHISNKTKLKVSHKFIEDIIEYMYEKAGYLHIKQYLPILKKQEQNTTLEELFF